MKKSTVSFLFLIVTFFASAQSSINWSSPMDIAASTFNNKYPRIALDGKGNPLVIWGNTSNSKAFFSRWDGATFTSPVALNPDSIPIYAASWTGPDIASKGDTVYAVFKRTPYETNPSYIVRSFDGGINFSSPIQVDFIADSISWLPTITADANGNPLVAFMKLNASFLDSRWVVAKSNDFGNTFSTDVKASGYSGGEVCDCCPGAIISSGNTAVMLYRDNDNNIRDIWAGISNDGGNSFGNGIGIDGNNWLIMACPASGPDGVIIDDTLYSVYMSEASGKSLVYDNKNSISSLSSSIGNSITGNLTGLTQQNYPRIAHYNKAVARVWKQVISSSTQLALSFTDNIQNGFPAGYDTVSFGSSGSVANGDVALFNGVIHTVWEDGLSGTVRYRKGTYTNGNTGLHNLTIAHSAFFISPNPANTDFITIQLKDHSSQNIGIEIFNTLGEILINAENKYTIDISSLPAGIYFIKLRQGNNIYTQKLVKQ